MDSFLLAVNSFSLAAQGVAQLLFASALTGRRPQTRHFICYFLALALVEWGSLRLGLPEICAVGADLLILYGMLRLVLANRRLLSCIAAVLALYLMYLSSGVVDSVEMLLFFRRVPDAWI